MKKLISILTLALCLPAFSATFNTWTLTVTNRTTNGQTITLNGNVRTFTNVVAFPSTQIQTNATAGGSATNVFNQIGNYRVSGIAQEITSTNVVKFYGYDATLSVSAGWATLTSDSAPQTNKSVVTVPASMLPVAERTNIISLLALDFNNYSQNAFSQTSTVMSEVSGLTNAQTIPGVKTMTHLIATNAVITNSYANGNTNNDAIFKGFIRLPSFSEESVLVTALATVNGVEDQVVVTNAPLVNVDELNTLDGIADDGLTVLQKLTAKVDETNGVALSLSINDAAYPRFDNSALANGVNAAVSAGTNSYLKVSGPSAAFTINGIAGGRDGKQLQIQNSTGYPMTIANDSGADATPANRIYTGQGADLVVSNIHAVVSFTYDGSLSRWILHTFSGTNAVTGGGGSQTPIAQTVNYAGFGATNIGVVSTTNLNVFGTVTVPFVIATNADYQIRTNDYAVIVDMTSIGASTDAFLPTNAPQRMVLELSVYDPDVNYAVTVRSPDGEDIRTPQGSVPTLVLESFGGAGDKTGSAKFIHSGTNWWVISRNTNPQ